MSQYNVTYRWRLICIPDPEIQDSPKGGKEQLTTLTTTVNSISKKTTKKATRFIRSHLKWAMSTTCWMLSWTQEKNESIASLAIYAIHRSSTCDKELPLQCWQNPGNCNITPKASIIKTFSQLWTRSILSKNEYHYHLQNNWGIYMIQ